MKRELLYSIILHVLIVATTLLSAPFSFKKSIDPRDVIKVSLLSGPLPGEIKAAIPPAITAPAPRVEKKAVAIDKPKPKPKQTKPKAKPKPQETAAPLTETNTPDETTIDSNLLGSGAPFGGATIDNSAFTYPYWFRQAFTKISTNWRNPVDADGAIVAVVYFQVIRSGRVIETRVETSSGIEAFDQACIHAIESSAPFPPLPREFRDEIIGITLPFKYEPR